MNGCKYNFFFNRIVGSLYKKSARWPVGGCKPLIVGLLVVFRGLLACNLRLASDRVVVCGLQPVCGWVVVLWLAACSLSAAGLLFCGLQDDACGLLAVGLLRVVCSLQPVCGLQDDSCGLFAVGLLRAACSQK